jgi:hypothetical protein
MTKVRAGLVAGAVCLLGGAVIGAVLEAHSTSEREDRELFAAKLHCQTIGEKYAADNTTPPIGPSALSSSVSILLVDYSRASHSCIALTETQTAGAQAYSVVDLVTNQIYGGGACEARADCKNRYAEIMKKAEATFNQAVSGEIHPLAP